MAEPLESQTNVLIQKAGFFNKLRVMIGHARALREEESHLYMLYGHILTTFCETAGDPLDVDRALGCEPQSAFAAPTGTRFDRRIPDFTVMVTFFHDIDVVDRFSPSYRSPTLGFWLEVKPLNCKDNWMSDEGHRTARRDVWSHLAQLNEQAMFAFNHFTGDTFYGMLILGIYFSVFEYLRPTPPPTHPPSPSELHPPTDGNQPQKRQKRKRDHDVSTYRAYVDQEVEPEYFSLTRVHPRTLYYCEPILMNDGEDFNPLFRKALWDIMAWREMDFPFQPSFFTLPRMTIMSQKHLWKWLVKTEMNF
ncbi:hypothetical protein SCP_0900850 [Sparassis crispa]|uniref:Uncharacterized protein n=1 Tax=Sparassis crispa TaxID=139825 RepID=A0A401GVH5_9APHY|nr:hypothetical protein SCP_0900850 [Sparassis crispa]GBE86206.1 hypothetical protein SCP_0900850 [Sparassis crispa]